MSFVAVDMGASGTRYVSDKGNIGTLPNNMEVMTDVDTYIDQALEDSSIERALEVVITKKEAHTLGQFPIKLLVGRMAERYHTPNLRPNSLLNKHAQPLNYYNALLAVAVSKLYDPDLPDTLDLYAAYPPVECDKETKADIDQMFKGTYTIKFIKLEKEVTFTINKTYVFEESFMAMLSFFFEMNGSKRKNTTKWFTGNVLSIDIGDSTTDFALVQDGRYMNRSGQTYKIGGRFSTNSLINQVRRLKSYELPIEYAQQGIAEGRLRSGDTFEDASTMVEKAKRDFASQLKTHIENYFNQIGLPPAQIRAIVVSGGGSLQGQYVDDDGANHVTSKPMSDYITDELSTICKDIAVISYGDNPRLANVSGLFIRAQVNESKKKAAGASGASAKA